MDELVIGLGIGLAYAVIGIVLMVLGFLVVDLLMPGKLRQQIWVERNRNAALITASGLAGTALIVVTSILTSSDDVGTGLLWTAGYGLLGLVLMAGSFALLDLLTPGRLGELLTQEEPHPAAWISAVTHVGVAGIVAAAIS